MFVAAMVRLFLPRVALRRITDAKSLLRPRHIRIGAVPFPEANQGSWMAIGRPQRRIGTRPIRLLFFDFDS